MYCKNCKNEILEGEKFCGKCGTKIDLNVKKETNTIKEKTSIKIKPRYIIIGIIAIIFIISIVIMINNNKSMVIKEAGTSSISSTSTKQYYDFIDTKYYTFNFDEKELLNRLFNGQSYSSAGYKKSASTKDNATMLYGIMTSNGVETISITTSSQNYKVKKFSFSLVATDFTEEKATNTMSSYLLAGTQCLLDTYLDSSNEEKRNEILSFIEEMSSMNGKKGLNYTYKQEVRNVEVTFEAIK
jgi:hypothetical protein